MSLPRLLRILSLLGLAVALAGCGPSPEQKKANAVAEKARTTGKLVVKTNRADATVDAQQQVTDPKAGGAKASGPVAQPLIGLTPGRYDLVLHSEGWPDVHAQADVGAGAAVEVTANFPSGALRVESLPVGATVRRGTQVLGRTPLSVAQVPAGDWELTIDYPLWPPVTTKVTIPDGGEAATSVRLPHGRLVVESSPANATVMFGKRALGQTPLTIERFQAGPRKLVLQSRDFPPFEVEVNVPDQGEQTIHPSLAEAFPLLDPPSMLREVWWEAPPKDALQSTRDFDPFPGFHRQGSIVRNLNRKKLFERWLNRTYRCSGKVKAYDRINGQVILADETTPLTKYRILVSLGPGVRMNADALAKATTLGATFAFYGRLAEMEETERIGPPIDFLFTLGEPIP